MNSIEDGKNYKVTNVFLKGDTMVVTFSDGTMQAIFSNDGKLIFKPYVGAYVKYRSYSIEQVLPFIAIRTKKYKRIYDGMWVNMGSMRYRCFEQSGIKCVSCGLEGLYFTLERNLDSEKCHFNLYGFDKDGNEVMLTKDQIIPASEDGSNGIDNMQTMCSRCNSTKGKKTTATDIENGRKK